DMSTNSPTSWNWDFGDGATSTVKNPSHTYTASGTYSVCLSTTNPCGGDAYCQTVTVNNCPSPVANFFSNITGGLTVNFSDASTGSPTTWTWVFGDASPVSNLQNPTHTYSASGTYTVCLTASNVCGVSSPSCNTVTVTFINNSDFSSSAPSCIGQLVNFYADNTDTLHTTYSWNFGSGSIATFVETVSQNPTGIVYATSGAKTIVLTTTNTLNGSTSSTTHVITINPSPVVSFTSTAPACVGSLIDFTNTGSSETGVIYKWDFGSSATPAISISQNPSGISYSSSGTKTVTLTLKNEFGCSASATQTITINETPKASFTSNAPRCTGYNVDFTNTGTVIGVTWAWDFGSGATPAT
ncbi:MAG TPA: PKD domain-containing protein, partial [Bacteroidia bacterium]